MTASVQFLFATTDGALFESNANVLDRAKNYLVINQSRDDQRPHQDFGPNVLSVSERGLSRSRNLAIAHATADICYFCDDDIKLCCGATERVAAAFAAHPGADLLIFPRVEELGSASDSNAFRSRLPIELRILGVSSIQIAFRRASVISSGIKFDERFGLGAPFASCEDAIFLSDCHRAGLQIEWANAWIVAHPMESSGSNYSGRSLAVAKGAMLSRVFGPLRHLYGIAFAIKSYPLYRRRMGIIPFLAALEQGAREFKSSGATPMETGHRDDEAMNVFEALSVARIRYAVFKDLVELDSFCEGDSELDILVHEEDLRRFETVCLDHGYSAFKNHVDLYSGKILHLLRFAGGRYFHLHIHIALLTGDHAVKEFDLTRIFGEGIFAGPARNCVRTVTIETELAIGIARLFLKAKSSDGIKLDELERLRRIATPVRRKDALGQISRHIVLPESSHRLVERILEGDDEAILEISLHAAPFETLRRLDRMEVWKARLHLRAVDAIARLDGLSNKVMRSKAPTIAVVGVDGVGKTTLCDRIERTLRAKVSIKRIYLGSNEKTYSLLTRLVYYMHGMIYRAARSKSNVSLLREVRHLMLALLEYTKCRDRISRIRRGRRYADRGVVVLFERYPMKGLYDYPQLAGEVERGEVRLEGLIGRATNALLHEIDRRLLREGYPEATLLCTADYEQIAARRPLQVDEELDIRRKLKLLERFDHTTTPNLHVIENHGDPAKSFDAALTQLNRQLCSRSW